ncbi:hypothetical protein [Psychrobacter sp. BF1]|uniref:hypothetical protein n=1 Tax=Psychrobacter sp. BF1 TaxID=2821147 RepID=UPI001C4E161C|nr:hypothetical protein [Psychrobacter sp. BF1]
MIPVSTVDKLNYSQYLIYGQSDGNNLLGFEIDVEAYVCDELKCFSLVQERNDNANCMLVLHCKFADNFSTQQIADYIEEKWLKYICYRDFEKHYIEVIDNQLIFYYVTRSDVGLGVTGKIVAT